MGVGISSGQSYKDESEWLATVDRRTSKQRSDQDEMNFNARSGDFQSRFYATDDFRMAPQASTELAGALKNYGRTGTPGNAPNIEIDLPKAPFGATSDLELPEGSNIGRGFPKSAPQPRDDTVVIKTKNPLTDITESDIQMGIAVGMGGGPGTMMGVKSKIFNKTNLYKAQEMEINGASADEIWEQTKTFKGADGRWRQEIGDQDMLIKHNGIISAVDKKGNEYISIRDRYEGMPDTANLEVMYDFLTKGAGKKIRLPEVLDHPELFKAYPFLKEVGVGPMPSELTHMGLTKGNDIFIAKLPSRTFHEVLMHEVQHMIQHHEGFARGGTAKQFLPKEFEKARKLLNDARKELIPPILQKGFTGKEVDTLTWIGTLESRDVLQLRKNNANIDNLIKKAESAGVFDQTQKLGRSEKLIGDARSEAFAKYESIMGEVESRNVEDRLFFDQGTRDAIPPYRTEQISRDKQIYNPLGTTSAGK